MSPQRPRQVVDSRQQLAAYVFGVAFVIVMLMIAIFIPRPDPFPYTVFRIVLALAAAGVAAMIPGFLHVNVGTVVRAGGAIAVFVITFFFSPAGLVATMEPKLDPPPPGDPKQVAEEFLAVADTLQFERIWKALSKESQKRFPRADTAESYRNAREPLGQVDHRELHGVNSTTSVPGWPPAHYRIFGFMTTFKNGRVVPEQVVVMSEDNVWRVASHLVGSGR